MNISGIIRGALLGAGVLNMRNKILNFQGDVKSLYIYKNRKCGVIVHETATHQVTVEF